MTDITDQDKRDALAWAGGSQAIGIADAAARVILATVDAPEPTLAEEVKKGLLFRVNDTDAEGIKDALGLAGRVEQIEQERDQARAEVEQWKAEWEYLDKQRIEEVERLTTERQEETMRRMNERYTALPLHDRDWTRADGLPDPAGVKPGEVWSANIWYDDERHPGTAIKSAGGDWVVTRGDGSHTTYRMNEYVELVAPLVPEVDMTHILTEAAHDIAATFAETLGLPAAPRVITTRDELDALPDGSIIRDHNDGEAMQKIDGDWRGTAGGEGYDDYCPTATVLWTPEETK